MTSAAIEQVTQKNSGSPDVGLAYFYCLFNDAASHEPINILGSIPASLAGYQPEILLALEPSFKEARKTNFQDRARLEEIETQLIKCIQGYSKVYIFVDAINESKYHDDVLKCLLRLVESSEDLYIMITSTGYGTLQDEYDAVHKSLKGNKETTRVYMDDRGIAEDIEAFVEASLQNLTNLRRLKDSLRDEIREALIPGSQGM